jgi:hypothetical protein
MSNARRGWWAALHSLPLVVVVILGCSRPPQGSTTKEEGKREDVLQQVREAVRAASETSAYQKALELANNHLAANPDALRRYQPGAKDRPAVLKVLGLADAAGQTDAALERKLLTGFVGLDEGELREVEATRFSPLDAHYLEFCCLLRDAARSLRLNERAEGKGAKGPAARLEQVRRAFDWVNRQVILHERGLDLDPPEFALRRGQGSASERALIFLTLLRQADLDGCLIAYPGKDGPVYWLAGVLLADSGGGDVYLFDPRLGLPVPGPDGGIATLAQLRSQPEILKQFDLKAPYEYDVKPEQAAKAEVHLALPLSALSPRMRFLENVLGAQDRVNLALRPALLVERFEAAKAGPVRVGNRRSEPGKPAPRTPTRALRESLPPEQGGVDRWNRYVKEELSLVPWFPIKQALKEMKIEEGLGKHAEENLIPFVVRELFRLYGQGPRDQILRGRFEEASKRLVRLERALGEYRDAPLDDKTFTEQLGALRARILKALREGGGDQKIPDLILGEDQVLQVLMLPNEPEVDRRKLNKGLLGAIVFRAADSPLRKQVAYLQALRWQEKAERLQARLAQLAAGKGGAADRLGGEAADAWHNARSSWDQYLQDNPLTPGVIAGRAERAQELWQEGNKDTAIVLLDNLFRELRQSLAARCLEARALQASGEGPAAAKALERLRDEARAAEGAKVLQAVRAAVLQEAPAPARESVDVDLFGDLRPGGTLHWTAYRAGLELRRLSGK